jgi:hypothetical protein
MLKITVVEGRNRLRLIVEGRLVAPWSAELTTACESAKADLQNRALIVDLRALAAIDAEGEAVLLRLMREEVKFLCGVYMKEVLKQLARKARLSPPDGADKYTDSDV